MVNIVGIQNLSLEEVNKAIENGAKFVTYRYTVSIFVLTLRKSSDIFLVQSKMSALPKIIGYSFINLLLGWWAIPWGPVYTISSLAANMSGGKDVSKEVLLVLNQDPGHYLNPSQELLNEIIIE